MTRNLGCVNVVAAAIATFAVFGSNTEAEAVTTWRNFAPSLCRASNSDVVPSVNSNGVAFNNSSTTNSWWECPVANDSNLQSRAATKAQVWGYQNSVCGGVYVQVELCRTYYTGGGGACSSAYQVTTTNANFTLQMTPGAEWNGAYPDSYVFDIVVPEACSGTASGIFGYDYET